jgi:cysteine desulfuration protein SufE
VSLTREPAQAGLPALVSFGLNAPTALREGCFLSPTGVSTYMCLDGSRRLRNGVRLGNLIPLAIIDEIIENFALLDEWDDRYRYLIELGKTLTPLSERDRADANKVQGCASQVWLATTVRPNGAGGPVLSFVGDSDAHIVRGLIAVLFALFSERHAREILATDAIGTFERLGLREHLTPQRSNGFRSMVERIRSDARAALFAAEALAPQ